jgi:hypothetical protein
VFALQQLLDQPPVDRRLGLGVECAQHLHHREANGFGQAFSSTYEQPALTLCTIGTALAGG